MVNRMLEWTRGVISKMFTSQNIKQAVGAEVLISQSMISAIQMWTQLYQGQPDWITTEVKSLGLPTLISGEIARMATIEMAMTVSGSPRAEFLNAQIQNVINKIRQFVEYGNAKGGLIFKPYVQNGQIAVDYVQADAFYPVSFDANGNITGVVFADTRAQGGKWYTRLEIHRLENSACLIRNLAYKSNNQSSLGYPCSLTEVASWAELPAEATVESVIAPLYGFYRYPSANHIDTTSPLGVSCFSRAQDASGNIALLRQADEIYSSLVWEFESGKRRLFVDALAFERDSEGKPKLPDRDLYRTLRTSGSIGGGQEMFEVFSPEFREASIKSGLDAVLKKIEFAVGFANGTISDPQAVALTATEIKSSQQRTYATITDVQKSISTALTQLVYAMDVYATIYNLAPRGTYQITYDFDDSIITDKEAQRELNREGVDIGAMSLVEWRMRVFGEDLETAKAKILMARTERADRVMDRVSQVRQ